MSKPQDLLQGTLDLLILKILALEPLNGWSIGERLKQVEWKASENNRRAKFYSLTRLGRKHLSKEEANWNRLSSANASVMRLEEA